MSSAPGTILGNPDTDVGFGDPLHDIVLGVPDVLTLCPVVETPCIGVECCEVVYNTDAVADCVQLLTVTLLSEPDNAGTVTGSGRYLTGTDVPISEIQNSVAPLAVGADIVVIVDESGSMDASWIFVPTLISELDTRLRAAGIGAGSVHNRYGLIGQGIIKGASSDYTPMTAIRGEAFDYYMGGTALWTDIDPANPTVGLDKILTASLLCGTNDISGGRAFEDAYAGIHRAIQGRTWRDGVAKVIVFFTDEDRNYPTYSSETVLQDYGAYVDTDWEAQRARMTAEIASWGGTVHGAVNVRMADSTSLEILGQESAVSGVTYKVDGVGGFITGDTGRAVGQNGVNTGWDGDSAFKLPSNVIQDYYDMLVAIPNSTIWDYVLFGQPGPDHDTNQASFTAALVFSLAQNIVKQVGWSFDGWFYTNGDLFSLEPSVTLTLSEKTVLVAHYSTASP